MYVQIFYNIELSLRNKKECNNTITLIFNNSKMKIIRPRGHKT